MLLVCLCIVFIKFLTFPFICMPLLQSYFLTNQLKHLSNLMVTLGDLQFGRTDMGVANLFLRFPEAEYVGFTYPYSFDRYCFLVRLLYVYFLRE